MKPAKYTDTIYQGATYSRTFAVPSGLDLSLYSSARMQIRPREGANYVWDSRVNNSLTISGQNIILNITAAETANFDFTTAGADIELVKNQNPEYVDKFIKFAFTLDKEWTKNLSA